MLYFLLENDQFVLHFRIDVSLLIRWPKSPESIADDVAEACRLFIAKNVIPQLRKYVLPLLQLLPDLLLVPCLPFILHLVRLLHCIRYGWHHHSVAGHGILQDQLLDASLVFLSSLLVVLPGAIHRWLLRPRHCRRLLIIPRVMSLAAGSALVSVSRSLSFASHDLILTDLALELNRSRQARRLSRPLQALGILLVDLPQIDVLMHVLLFFVSLSGLFVAIAFSVAR